MTTEERFDKEDFDGFLNQLLDMQHLENPGLGITRQVEGRGYNSLPDRQKYVFKTQVVDVFYTEACKMCSESIF